MANMRGISIFALLVMSAACLVAVKGDVVELTDSTFTDKVKEKDTLWFIKFFAPWCGHCKRLAPTWEELGKALEGEDGVEVATVDCTTNKATCGKADIRSYPTLKLFLNGEEYKKYSGPRDLESLKAYALEGAAEVAKAGTNPDEAAL
jgi:protein disulfide-isomerase-like protein